jgi:undecaprenyl-diphosphatase
MTEKRVILLYTLLVCIPGLVAARWLAAMLPFRERPLFNPNLHLNRAFLFDSDALEHWSSFPSDHAVLFFALATGIWFVNKKAGLFLHVYTIVCIVLPRIFLGIHYPTDMLAGALFGIALGYSAKFHGVRSVVARSASRLQKFSPGLFYACWSFLICQTAVLYGPLRGGVQIARELLHAWLKGVH